MSFPGRGRGLAFEELRALGGSGNLIPTGDEFVEKAMDAVLAQLAGHTYTKTIRRCESKTKVEGIPRT